MRATSANLGVAWSRPASRPRAVPSEFDPNVLTRDVGTSRLAQGCSGQLSLVEAERYNGPLPRVKAFDPPPSAT